MLGLPPPLGLKLAALLAPVALALAAARGSKATG